MTIEKKLLGTSPSGGDSQNVEKVFSTYLYDGTGTAQGIDNGINLGDFGLGTSTEFDGTNDYLSRSTSLSGSSDGKTITISFWMKYFSPVGLQYIPFGQGGGGINLNLSSSGAFEMHFKSPGNQSYIVNADTPSQTFNPSVWNHFLISFDLTSTSRRYLYVNDIAVTVSWWSYTNSDISRGGNFAIQNYNYYNNRSRYAHFFLDYTYRDLSTTSNRRLFIDGNGGSTPPATLSALNPILYLPMTEGYTIGENIGTGGDFTANGSPTIINKGTEYVAGSGEGGLVWLKSRTSSFSHTLLDTERGVGNYLDSTSTSAEDYSALTLSSFNSDGFAMGGHSRTNASANNYASWTFRKAPRFFDVVTYTGDGVAGREIAHDLGCDVGMIIVKSSSDTNHWRVYHRSLGGTKSLQLNSFSGQSTNTMWNNTNATSSVFTVDDGSVTNILNYEYVAYLFAHDPVGAADDGMIACGSVTANSSADVFEDLGWEPQYILLKSADSSTGWLIIDAMRGAPVGADPQPLQAQSNYIESGGYTYETVSFRATGFDLLTEGSAQIWGNANEVIYMAIRGPMMVEPESGTEVFAVSTDTATEPAFDSQFPVDFAIKNDVTGGDITANTRMLGNSYLIMDNTDAESGTSFNFFDYMKGWNSAANNLSYRYSWMFKRAKGFMDVVAYTGDYVARTVAHNLGVAPEMIWIKQRSGTRYWTVYHSGNGNSSDMFLSEDWAIVTGSTSWNTTSPTDSVFSLGAQNGINQNTYTYIAYLFATLAGVSKVGNYTGNGSNQNIACGFSGGARFVMIKRTDSTGDWYMWDTERGIVAGNDPHLSLNTTAAQVTSDDSIDPYSTGFTVNQVSATDINVTNGTYIFLAIA